MKKINALKSIISGMNKKKVWYKHTMKYHSALKRKEILTHDAAWMNLEDLYVVTYKYIWSSCCSRLRAPEPF